MACRIADKLKVKRMLHLISFFFFSCPTSELSEQFPRELYSDICLEFRHIHAHTGHLFTVLVSDEWRS